MNKKSMIVVHALLLIGCSILFYPTISDYVNYINQSRAIVEYGESLGRFQGIEIEEIKERADVYNQTLANLANPLAQPDEIEYYDDYLNPFDNGMMGSVIIEKINVNLPIYHGVNEGVIQKGVGHLPGSSLPVGGKSTHAVISTHSGLPAAKLFTDLNQLEIGDEFILSILGSPLYYQVDQIETVLPHEIDHLKIIEDKDYVTMFTCTPYGINTHRLLVRGERVFREISPEDKVVDDKAKDDIKINGVKLVLITGLLFVLLILLIRDFVQIFIEKRKVQNKE